MITKRGVRQIYYKNNWQKHQQPHAEKPKKPHIQHEAQEQTTLFEWAGLQRGKYPKLDDMFHIANGGYRDPREAANLKRQGVKAGVPDICLPVARGGYHGLYIELKYGKNKPTLEQQVWLGRLLRNGYEAKVCYGWEQAKNEIIKYLNLECEENMLNNVSLMGRLTAAPELKSTSTASAVTEFTLAVERAYAKQGEQRQTDFIDCVAWRTTAEFITKYFQKGSMIAVTGSIQTRSYEDKNGNKRKAVEILVNSVSFCGSKTDTSVPPSSNAAFDELGEDEDLPF